ncbi:unnamed protein product [Effrenium voratum]|nr:unnamed protein product [Effrenium voratum]
MCLRVACLQVNPVHGKVAENRARAREMLERRQKELQGVQLLVLPEMAFTGYHWRSKEHISEVVETSKGPTSQWCKEVAKMLRCVVCCGLPLSYRRRLVNSMLVVGPKGTFVTRVDKVHLYESDKTWAEPGKSFKSLERVEGLPIAPVGFGICMDINPLDFKNPPEMFEFANFHREKGSRLLIFTSAWCKNHPDDSPEAFRAMSDQDLSRETLNTWLRRLGPLHGREVYFVCANRVGREPLELLGRNTELQNQFCGTSCVISLRDQQVLEQLSASEEGLLIADIPIPELEDVLPEREKASWLKGCAAMAELGTCKVVGLTLSAPVLT